MPQFGEDKVLQDLEFDRRRSQRGYDIFSGLHLGQIISIEKNLDSDIPPYRDYYAVVDLFEDPTTRLENVLISQPWMGSYELIGGVLAPGAVVIIGWLPNARPIIMGFLPYSYVVQQEAHELEDLVPGLLVVQGSTYSGTPGNDSRGPGGRIEMLPNGNIRCFQEWIIYKKDQRTARVEVEIGEGATDPIVGTVRLSTKVYDINHTMVYQQLVGNNGAFLIQSKSFNITATGTSIVNSDTKLTLAGNVSVITMDGGAIKINFNDESYMILDADGIKVKRPGAAVDSVVMGHAFIPGYNTHQQYGNLGVPCGPLITPVLETDVTTKT